MCEFKSKQKLIFKLNTFGEKFKEFAKFSTALYDAEKYTAFSSTD